jgi:hypothetical protein
MGNPVEGERDSAPSRTPFRQATKTVRLPTGIGVHLQTGMLFGITTEPCSASERNRCSPSPEYPSKVTSTTVLEWKALQDRKVDRIQQVANAWTEPMTTDALRAFVEQSIWTFAKTMPKNAHEYTLRKKAKDEALFERVVMHIRARGYRKNFNGRGYLYFDLDGWQYWTMGSPLSATILINRATLP